jgi:hypothetical protein
MRFHPLSFGTGLASGLLIMVIVGGGMRLMRPASTAANGNAPAFQQRQGGAGGAQNTARMAQRLGITEEELTKELAAGKTMQQIASEHGVTMPAGGGFRPRAGSGTAASASPSSASSLTSSVSSR